MIDLALTVWAASLGAALGWMLGHTGRHRLGWSFPGKGQPHG